VCIRGGKGAGVVDAAGGLPCVVFRDGAVVQGRAAERSVVEDAGTGDGRVGGDEAGVDGEVAGGVEDAAATCGGGVAADAG